MPIATPLLALVLAAATTAAPAKPPTPTATPPKASPAATHVLPWIEDDWPRAVAEAKARKIPIFVESWAPW